MGGETKTEQEVVQLLVNQSPTSCRSNAINFEDIKLPMYKGFFATMIDDLLSSEECASLLEAAESSTCGRWDPALVNTGMGNQALYTDIRLCDRIILDHPEIAEKLMTRIMPHLPPEIVTLSDNGKITGHGPVKRKEKWRISRLNERLRFLKYTNGMYFREHADGSYVTPDGQEISFLTVHIYLNGAATPSKVDVNEMSIDHKPLKGGATRFYGYSNDEFYDVSPSTGACLVFQHRNLIHSGEDVLQGTKYTMRTDVMYHKVEEE